MTPEEKDVLDAAVHWFHCRCDADRVDAAVATLLESRKPKPKWNVVQWGNGDYVLDRGGVYVGQFHRSERGTADRVALLLNIDDGRAK